MFRWRGGRKAKVILEVFCCRLFLVQPPTRARVPLIPHLTRSLSIVLCAEPLTATPRNRVFFDQPNTKNLKRASSSRLLFSEKRRHSKREVIKNAFLFDSFFRPRKVFITKLMIALGCWCCVIKL